MPHLARSTCRALRRLFATALGLLAAVAGAQAPVCPPTAQPPTAQQLQDASGKHARDRGFLWRISKDGRTSYLYGTIHLGRFEWALPGPAVTQALRETDTLALEIDLGDPQTMQGIQTAMTARPGVPPLPAALNSRLQRQLEVACVPAEAFAPLHPVMQAMTLAALAGRWDGLDPAFSQEGALAALARAARQRIVSLETPELQIASLVPTEPARVQAMVELALEQLEDGRVRRQLRLLAGVWERGDLAELERYESWCECVQDDDDRAFLRRLNDERNPGLADRIDALHRESRRVFAAVGSLHMSGARALPALMRERGYTVERIAFTP